jgi:hypothetical protein
MIDGVATNRILSCIAGAFIGTALVVVLALHEGVPHRCVPGEQPTCACADGSDSFQVCKEDGKSYTTCGCGSQLAAAR